MPTTTRRLRRAETYFPPAIYELLQKRAERNFNSISRELVHIVAKALQEDEQQQSQNAVSVKSIS